MTTGIMVNGADLANVFGSKGSSTAAATGIKSNGTDLNQLLLALADGKSIGYNTGIKVNGTDLSSIFGIANSNTPLPINGQTFLASSSSGTSNSSASCSFQANNATWQVSGTSSSGGSVPSASGSIPTGAVSMQISYTITDSAGAGSVTNQAGSQTTLTSSFIGIGVNTSSTPPSGDNHRFVAVTINFYNSSNANISTTSITLKSESEGAA